MMKNPKISVIVPIYNIEEYLEDALDCLTKQSFIENMEVLMIDDGSTDNSRYIIEKYALDFDNFFAYHKENEGPTVARNYAIEFAKGEYITFFDGDDHINRDIYEKLYNMAKKNDSDISIANSIRLRRYNLVDSLFFKKSFENIDKDIDCTNLEETPDLLWDLFLWNKLFKRELILDNNIRFIDEKCYYADAPFTLKAYAYAKRISVSKDIFYYWRYRENKNLSITQKSSSINNFYDRIKIIDLCFDVIKTGLLNESLIKDLYSKILNHDLHVHLKKFYQYDEVYYPDIVEKVSKIISIIPNEIKDDLNSFKKIIYKMVENKDYDGLYNFSSLYLELMKNPHIPKDLDGKYIKFIDFEKDAIDEELIVKKENIYYDNENIYIDFTEKINYLKDDTIHKTNVYLVCNDNEEYKLELNDLSNLDKNGKKEFIKNNEREKRKSKQITIPINFISNKQHMRIKVEYIGKNLKKEAFLRNSKREVMSFENFDAEIGIGINRILYIDIRPTNDLKIKIKNVEFVDEVLEFYGISDNKIDNVYIENVITFEKIKYPVLNYEKENKYTFKFSIPYNEILERPIRKWELKTERTFKTIELDKKFEFYTLRNKIRVLNTRNKILISDDFYNSNKTLEEDFDEILRLKNEKSKLKQMNKKLKKENKHLKEENKALEKTIEKYKSRFVVKTTDKIKKIL